MFHSPFSFSSPLSFPLSPVHVLRPELLPRQFCEHHSDGPVQTAIYRHVDGKLSQQLLITIEIPVYRSCYVIVLSISAVCAVYMNVDVHLFASFIYTIQTLITEQNKTKQNRTKQNKTELQNQSR
jgi:hypothetical protein